MNDQILPKNNVIITAFFYMRDPFDCKKGFNVIMNILFSASSDRMNLIKYNRIEEEKSTLSETVNKNNKTDVVICEYCGNTIDTCMCACPYCGEVDACECCLFDAVTGG
ncbi:MAG TPA: hypothetical protein VEL11_09765 [Candidatus Bathyarchaeia archaeon]|nr:hypothetical protein [Candidatus Bathyarchaeia archaeon]